MATKKYSTKTLAATVLIFMLYASSNVDAIHRRRNHVYIKNGLEGSKDLTFKCKSKDDDLGLQVLKPDQTWHFDFHPNFFGGTLFFCRFMWDGIDFRYFDIFDRARDEKRGNNHCWTIRSDGACRCPCDQTCDFTACDPWNPRRLPLI